MHAGWRQYIKQRLKTPSKYFSLGIEFGSEAVQVSVLKKESNEIQWVKQHILPLSSWQSHLAKYVSQESLTNTPAHVIVSSSKYQILQVEKPNLPDAEISQALVWSVKDLVNIQEDITVDYFDLPAQGSGPPKVNVVALPKSHIEEILEGVSDANLELASIGILELAIADLVDQSEEAVLTLVQEAGQEVFLNIIKKGQVYFSRRLRGYENLSTFNAQELQMGVGDSLSVEIQRSMDYFESQLRQAPIKKILLGLESEHLNEFCDIMQKLTFMPTEVFKPIIHYADNLKYSNSYVGSLGAAYSHASGPHDEN